MTIDQYKRMFEFSGLKGPGQTVKVHGGRHHGLKSIVKDINWSEGEVLLTTKEGHPRWFSLAMVEVLDPIRSTQDTPSAPSIDSPPSTAPSPALQPVTAIPAPEPAPAPLRATPSWIPKPKQST